jgi:hypothetical protein
MVAVMWRERRVSPLTMAPAPSRLGSSKETMPYFALFRSVSKLSSMPGYVSGGLYITVMYSFFGLQLGC